MAISPHSCLERFQTYRSFDSVVTVFYFGHDRMFGGFDGSDGITETHDLQRGGGWR